MLVASTPQNVGAQKWRKLFEAAHKSTIRFSTKVSRLSTDVFFLDSRSSRTWLLTLQETSSFERSTSPLHFDVKISEKLREVMEMWLFKDSL